MIRSAKGVGILCCLGAITGACGFAREGTLDHHGPLAAGIPATSANRAPDNALGPPSRTLIPLPRGTRSVRVERNGTPVFSGPNQGAARRGTLRFGTRLASQGRASSNRCSAGWALQVAPNLFACEEHFAYSREAPSGEDQPPVPSGALLPFEYAFVRVDGTRTYRDPSDYGTERFVEALGANFGVVVTGDRWVEGLQFLRTRRGLWVEASALAVARGSSFEGILIQNGNPAPNAALRVGWVKPPGAAARLNPRGRVLRRLASREPIHIAERLPGGWARLTDQSFVRTAQLVLASRGPLPAGLAAEERWLDVDLSTQTLVAYEGTRPVFATLVSAGRRPRGPTATPAGTFRLWVKLAISDMDDLQRDDVRRNYAIESVPWVQYFEEGNGFHAAFWHDDFGRPRSHGCVNLSPKDAAFLFRFTRPVLPTGWLAIFASEEEQGTLVQVRESKGN